MQPDKLARSFKGDLDGMYARVLFAWPPEPGYRPLTNEVAEIEPEIVNALTRIVGLAGGQGKDGEFAPRSVSLSPEATGTFQQFLQFMHDGKHSLDGREREWWSKIGLGISDELGNRCSRERWIDQDDIGLSLACCV